VTSGQAPGTHHAQSHPVLPWDVQNQALVANVHPAEWINPTPGGRYNLVVIGAGTAGLVSAIGAAGLGAKVALVERDLMGGDCLNYGCVPSKALIRSSRAAYDAAHGAPFGVRVTMGAVDFERHGRIHGRLYACAQGWRKSVAPYGSVGLLPGWVHTNCCQNVPFPPNATLTGGRKMK
jgi:hypothetical protein